MEKPASMKEYEYNAKVMGTDLSVAIITNSKNLADNLYSVSLAEIQAYEKTFSRFLPDSELSQLNEKKEMVVSPIFMEVFLKAQELFLETNGVFNPLVQIERFGYDKNFDEIKNINFEEKVKDGETLSGNYDIDFSKIVVDRNLSKIILSAGQKLDFGGFLKGYLAEKIAKKIKLDYEKFDSEKIKGVIVNIGGDIHTQGFDANDQEFIFSIYNPITKQDDIQTKLYNSSLATSGTYKRFWQSSEKTIHHILDETGTKNPVSNVISASVINSDGSRADAYAKVFLSLGHEKALKMLSDENPENDKIQFIIIKNNGEIIKNTN
ncbi:MAG: FAD:protein FMN transferase [Lutibacter sp.]|jgi:thiamine biosynthesis lipoprotein